MVAYVRMIGCGFVNMVYGMYLTVDIGDCTLAYTNFEVGNSLYALVLIRSAAPQSPQIIGI
jgi:hypothetical protein